MSWSLSPDDDGLEPVVENSREATPRGIAPPPRAPHFRSGEPARTVVIDPHCQIPAAAHDDADFRPGEPTVILRQRQVDSLRAEVDQRRRAHFRRSFRNLLIWAASGAFAVLLGALLTSFAFSPEPADAQGQLDDGAPVEALHGSTARIDASAIAQEDVSDNRALQTSDSDAVPLRASARSAPQEPISPLLESGLEPGAVRGEDSPFEESGLVTLEDLEREAADAPDEEAAAGPVPVTLEDLMNE